MSIEIHSVVKTFAIIEYLSAYSEPQLLKTIADRCSLPPSTAHRLLSNLCALGYVCNNGGGQYRLTYKLFELSSKAVAKSSLIAIAKPHLDALSEQLKESVHLVVREGSDTVYIYKVTHSVGSIQLASRIGMRIPMHRTAVGKAILSTMGDDAVRTLLSACDLTPMTRHSLTSLDDIMLEIEKTRAIGYAVDDEENEDGVLCFANAIGAAGQEASYAFSVSTIKSFVSPDHRAEIITAIEETKRRIDQQLLFT